MVMVHQGVLSVPWYGKMACQALLLAVDLVAAAADCVFVMLVCH